MAAWLIIEVELHFSEKLRPITNQYRADLLADGAKVYAIINPGESHKLQVLLRAYPEDACADYEAGKKIFLKEGPLARAEGIILRRFERDSPAKSVIEFIREFEAQ